MPTDDSIPFGYCHCGCGQLTTIVKKTITKFGWFKGQPKRFINHHQASGNTQLKWLEEALRTQTSDCMPWPFGFSDRGYGRLNFKGAMVLAHRVAFYLTYGHWPTPEGCHECDNPLCFNPRHIFEGTQKENTRDCAKKLRSPKMKLTPAIVSAIRREYIPYSRSHGTIALAKKYNVANTTIGKLIARKTWKFVP